MHPARICCVTKELPYNASDIKYGRTAGLVLYTDTTGEWEKHPQRFARYGSALITMAATSLIGFMPDAVMSTAQLQTSCSIAASITRVLEQQFGPMRNSSDVRSVIAGIDAGDAIDIFDHNYVLNLDLETQKGQIYRVGDTSTGGLGVAVNEALLPLAASYVDTALKKLKEDRTNLPTKVVQSMFVSRRKDRPSTRGENWHRDRSALDEERPTPHGGILSLAPGGDFQYLATQLANFEKAAPTIVSERLHGEEPTSHIPTSQNCDHILILDNTKHYHKAASVDDAPPQTRFVHGNMFEVGAHTSTTLTPPNPSAYKMKTVIDGMDFNIDIYDTMALYDPTLSAEPSPILQPERSLLPWQKNAADTHEPLPREMQEYMQLNDTQSSERDYELEDKEALGDAYLPGPAHAPGPDYAIDSQRPGHAPGPDYTMLSVLMFLGLPFCAFVYTVLSKTRRNITVMAILPTQFFGQSTPAHTPDNLRQALGVENYQSLTTACGGLQNPEACKKTAMDLLKRTHFDRSGAHTPEATSHLIDLWRAAKQNDSVTVEEILRHTGPAYHTRSHAR